MDKQTNRQTERRTDREQTDRIVNTEESSSLGNYYGNTKGHRKHGGMDRNRKDRHIDRRTDREQTDRILDTEE